MCYTFQHHSNVLFETPARHKKWPMSVYHWNIRRNEKETTYLLPTLNKQCSEAIGKTSIIKKREIQIQAKKASQCPFIAVVTVH